MSQFYLDLVYIKGEQNAAADALSRLKNCTREQKLAITKKFEEQDPLKGMIQKYNHLVQTKKLKVLKKCFSTGFTPYQEDVLDRPVDTPLDLTALVDDEMTILTKFFALDAPRRMTRSMSRAAEDAKQEPVPHDLPDLLADSDDECDEFPLDPPSVPSNSGEDEAQEADMEENAKEPAQEEEQDTQAEEEEMKQEEADLEEALEVNLEENRKKFQEKYGEAQEVAAPQPREAPVPPLPPLPPLPAQDEPRLPIQEEEAGQQERLSSQDQLTKDEKEELQEAEAQDCKKLYDVLNVDPLWTPTRWKKAYQDDLRLKDIYECLSNRESHILAKKLQKEIPFGKRISCGIWKNSGA
jgi:hypothetical protein